MYANNHSHSPLIRVIRNLILTLSIGSTMVSCATSSSLNNWPDNLPDRSIFIDAYTEQSLSGTNSNNVEPHLVWIKRFYQGSALYSLGWNKMTKILIDSLDEEVDTAVVERRMYDLGIDISVEWAQDNRFRNIDSSAIAVWGNALRTAAEKKEQLVFIGKIERDVAALLAKQLAAKDIVQERYYPVEDFDDF